MSDLITALSDKGTTSLQKKGFVGETYSGIVTVKDVEEVWQISSDTSKPKVRIKIELGVLNPNWFILAFETTDRDKASKLHKGDKVNLTGKLVSFEVHASGYMNVPNEEWAIFNQVTINDK